MSSSSRRHALTEMASQAMTVSSHCSSPSKPPPTTPSEGLLSAISLELSAARAEVDRERTLRKLDQQRSTQSETRLRRQIEFLLEEVQDHKTSSQQLREQSEADVQSMKHRLEEALTRFTEAEKDNAALRRRMVALEEHNDKQQMKHASLRRKGQQEEGWEEECKSLRQALQEMEQRALRAEQKLRLQPMDSDDADTLQDVHQEQEEEEGSGRTPESAARKRKCRSPSSPAPPAVMRELTKTRLMLAEEQRSSRVLRRSVEDLKKQNADLKHVRSKATWEQDRNATLQTKIQTLQTQVEECHVLQAQWTTWRQEILSLFDEKQDTNTPEKATDQNKQTSTLPPEIATLLRHIQSLQSTQSTLQDQLTLSQAQNTTHQTKITSLQTLNTQSNSQISTLQKEKEKLQRQVQEEQVEVKRAQMFLKIKEEEVERIRGLLETYESREQLELASSSSTAKKKKKTSTSNSLFSFSNSPKNTSFTTDNTNSSNNLTSPTADGLRTSLTTAQSERTALRTELQTLTATLTTLRTTHDQLQSEHDRVLEKYQKLRSALMEERSKAEEATAKALEAERLVGKGCYNDETTRVLHLKQNPRMEAVVKKHEEEMELWKKKCELLEEDVTRLNQLVSSGTGGTTVGSNAASATSTATTRQGTSKIDQVNAQKYHQRLKESFKEQIALFREGVYLLTGYKVEMFASDSIGDDGQRPRFKVRSVYAEREEDHLMFMWPQVSKSGSSGAGGGSGSLVGTASSLDLLDSEMAQRLMKTELFQYVTKYDSIPAFMASLTMMLFEQQTMVAG